MAQISSSGDPQPEALGDSWNRDLEERLAKYQGFIQRPFLLNKALIKPLKNQWKERTLVFWFVGWDFTFFGYVLEEVREQLGIKPLPKLEFKLVKISSSQFIVHEMTWQVVLHLKKSQIASQFLP